MVLKVMAAMDTNPFTATTPALINIATGQCADPDVKDHLLNVKVVGHKLHLGWSEKDNRCQTENFHTHNLKSKKSKQKCSAWAGVMKLLPFFGWT